MRSKFVVVFLLIIAIMMAWPFSWGTAEILKPKKDSRELQFQDMLVLLLLPYMKDKLAESYSEELKAAPELYPYFVDVIDVERVNGFRGFHFRMTLDAKPAVGPHIPVGRDLFTFEISPVVGVKLINYKHLKGPDKKYIPPHYQHLLSR